MSALKGDPALQSTGFPKKRERDDGSEDHLPTPKKARFTAAGNEHSNVTGMQQTRALIAAIKQLPGEVRNTIYDILIGPIAPFHRDNKEVLHINNCKRSGILVAMYEKQGLAVREFSRAKAHLMRDCLLRVVSGLRQEFMTRFWNAFALKFCSLWTGVSRYLRYTFLRGMNVTEVLYQIHPFEIHDERVGSPSSNSAFKKISKHIFTVIQPFMRALEQMEFRGTARVTGVKAEVIVVGCLIDRLQKYWRLGNTLHNAFEACLEDGIWRLITFLVPPNWGVFLLRKRRRHAHRLPRSMCDDTTIDVSVDMCPSSRIPGIASKDNPDVFLKGTTPTDPFDGEPWAWHEIIRANVNTSTRGRTDTSNEQILEAYLDASRLIRPMNKQ